MEIRDVPIPEPEPNQVLVRVHAAALNYADTMQRRGDYQVPEGQTPIMGVEIAGVVAGWGSGVTGVSEGQRVYGLVEGGGYAEYCLMEQELVMTIPQQWSFETAVAVPEAFYAANETVFHLGNLREGQSVLIHAGGSGVGSAAIQMALYAGAHVFTTVGSLEKGGKALALGAHVVINYKVHDFAEVIQRHTKGQGVDLIEDFIGGEYFKRNISCLKTGGTLLLVGVLDGYTSEIEIAPIILRRLQIKGTAIRNRSLAEKQKVRERFEKRWLPPLIEGKLKPIVNSSYPIERVADAHRELEEGKHFGKIVLTIE
jgi:putative PIG3 family NAD(P)H quinone oxidoreductase